MASDIEARKLQSLRVTDLRNELSKRNLDFKGVKNELLDRLEQALLSEGQDPATYLFDIEQNEKKTPRNKRRTIGEGDIDKEDNSLHDSSSIVEGEVTESKVADEQNSKATENGNVEEIECVMEEDIVTADEAVIMKKEVDISPFNQNISTVITPETVAVKKKLKEEMIDCNQVSLEQRVKVLKKNVIEDSKEKSDANKEDVEDSINLTIGEDEAKLFGEEEEPTQDSDVKDTETQADTDNANEKEQLTKIVNNEQDGKQMVKPAAKKVISKVNGASRNLWVSGLSSSTRATDLKTLFSKCGKVVAAKIVTNAKTPGSRCYGYVTMLSPEDATSSLQKLHKTELNGKLILVERAKDDGTGPARSTIPKKESDKKKVGEINDEKRAPEDQKVPADLRSEVETEEKKSENKEELNKMANEDVHGEQKTGSVKSEKHSSRRSSKSKEIFINRPRDNAKNRAGVLTFAQIKAERERYHFREKERLLRMEEKRRQFERVRQREVERRQREEAARLERERLKLKMEREKIEREKAELLKMERETQRLERERLQREKEEIRRAQMKIEEARRAVKRPLEITRTFEDERKRRPPSPDRRHIHVASSSTVRKEIASRSNNNRRTSPPQYNSSRRTYESSIVEASRKEVPPHSSRDKSGKESSRYDHHSSYQSSHGSVEARSKDSRHRYPEPPSKSGVKESSRYERTLDNWKTSSSISSSVKPFNSVSSGGATLPSREGWSSSDKKSDTQPPWSRGAASTSDRWAGSGSATSSMSINRSGPLSGSSSMFGSSGNYSNTIPSMSVMGIGSGSSYSDRFDAYKSSSRKY